MKIVYATQKSTTTDTICDPSARIDYFLLRIESEKEWNERKQAFDYKNKPVYVSVVGG